MTIILVYNRMSDREDIKFFKVTKKTGRETHHFQVGLYRFDQRKIGKNGLGFFSCSNCDCRATLSAKYVENKDPE